MVSKSRAGDGDQMNATHSLSQVVNPPVLGTTREPRGARQLGRGPPLHPQWGRTFAEGLVSELRAAAGPQQSGEDPQGSAA